MFHALVDTEVDIQFDLCIETKTKNFPYKFKINFQIDSINILIEETLKIVNVLCPSCNEDYKIIRRIIFLINTRMRKNIKEV